jgi:hypothetical protein
MARRKKLLRSFRTSVGILKGRIQRVSDREMAAIKAGVESATPGADS